MPRRSPASCLVKSHALDMPMGAAALRLPSPAGHAAALVRWLIPLIVALVCAALARAQDPTRVLVIYNASWPDQNGNGVGDSLEVAQHYVKRRGVPASNLLAVNCSTTTSHFYWQLAGWTAFWDEVRTPVVNRLVQLGETNIDVLLFCYGVPYQLELPASQGGTRALDECMKSPYTIGTRTTPNPNSGLNPYYEPSPSQPPDLGRFNHSYTWGGQRMWLMARLDGVSPEASKDLVEGALYAERHLAALAGYYQGIGYVDSRYKSYTDPELQTGYPFHYRSYAAADGAMAYGKVFVQASGFKLEWENTASDLEIGEPGATFHDSSPAQLAPNAMFYGGWYNYGRYLDVWTWLPGSCAVDLNSNSLQGVRAPFQAAFLSQAFQRGLGCGTGCIAEPQLSGHPQPEKFLYFMLNGYTFAEAASLCNPTFSWVNLAIGDPLYAPTKAGRTPILDTTPPPQPTLRISAAGPTQQTLTAAIDLSSREPDLVKIRVEHGATRAYGNVIDYGSVYRTHHQVVVGGVAANALQHFRATLKDPAGHTTQTGDFVCTTRAYVPQVAGVDPKTQVAQPPLPATVELSVGHQLGIGQLTGLQVLLSAAHLNLVDADITSAALSLGTAVSTGPALELVSVAIAFPTTLPSGTYVVKVRAFASGVPMVEDQGSVVIP